MRTGGVWKISSPLCCSHVSSMLFLCFPAAPALCGGQVPLTHHFRL